MLLRGQAGVGKTALAQHLALRALERGMTVRFSTLPAALADLLRQESLPATERRLRRYVTPDPLVLDELGNVPCDDRSFHIVSRRHERRSIVVTTNLRVRAVGTVLRDASCLGALIVRFARTATPSTPTATPGVAPRPRSGAPANGGCLSCTTLGRLRHVRLLRIGVAGYMLLREVEDHAVTIRAGPFSQTPSTTPHIMLRGVS